MAYTHKWWFECDICKVRKEKRPYQRLKMWSGTAPIAFQNDSKKDHWWGRLFFRFWNWRRYELCSECTDALFTMIRDDAAARQQIMAMRERMNGPEFNEIQANEPAPPGPMGQGLVALAPEF